MRSVASFLICLLAAAIVPASAVGGTQDANAKLTALVVAYEKRGQTASGTWPDLSSHGLQNLESSYRTVLVALHTIPRVQLRPEMQDVYDLLDWQVNRGLDQMRVRLYLTPFWRDPALLPANGIFGALEPLWSLPQAVTRGDYQERIRKLEAFPIYMNQVVALLREAKKSHMLPARQVVWEAATSAGQWVNATTWITSNPFANSTTITKAEHALYAPFQSVPGNDTDEGVRVQEMARKVIHEQVVPAIKAYVDELNEDYLPACPEWFSLTQWPNGMDVYGVLLLLSTTTEIEPKHLQELGFSEVKRIRHDISVVAAKAGFQGSLNDFLANARTDPAFYFSSAEELLGAYRNALQEIQPLLPQVVRKIPKLLIDVEGSHGGAAAWYEAPNMKHDADVVHVDVGTPSIHPKFEVIPLMLHEALPGHALQHAVAREFARRDTDVLAAFVKQARQSTGFGEGWGLYSETLGYNLGLYRTPMEEFGGVRMKLTRAVRIAVDTGVHMSGWTREQAKSYAAANTGEPEQQIDLEVARALWPGVQPAYTVGEQQIEAIRDTVAKRLGQKFDLRAFDDAMLRWGPLPLDVMRHKVEACLDDEQCSRIFAVPKASS